MSAATPGVGPIRVANFNASLNRNALGELASDLAAVDDKRPRTVA